MKNIIRRINVIVISLITMLVLSTNVNAATDSYKTSISANNSQVHIGDKLILTISLSNISVESGEKGIGAYKSNIEFDSSIFEYVSTEGTDKWDEPFYQNETVIGTTKDGNVVDTAQDIGKITLKVKQDAELGDTTIKLTNFSASNAVTDMTTEDTSVKVTILEKVNDDEGQNNGNGSQNGNGENGNGQNGNGASAGSQNGGNQNGGSGNNGSQSGSKTNINDAEKDNFINGIIPQTGDINILTCTLISAFALVAITLLIRIKLIDRKMKKINAKKPKYVSKRMKK